jgi:hypothetical protein
LEDFVMAEKTVLTIPAPVFDRLVLDLETRFQGNVALCLAGEYRRGERLELLHRSTIYTRELDGQVGEILSAGLSPLVTWHGARPPNRSELRWCLDGFSRAGVARGAVLSLVGRKGNVEVFGWLKQGEEFVPIEVLSLPGAGMLELAVQPLWPLQSVAPPSPDVEAAAPTGKDEKEGPLSRLAGFLGEADLDMGWEILRKARRLRVVIVGCGRMGSRLAGELAQAGVGAEGWLIVIDEDNVEPANLDFMRLPRRAVGMPKAEAVARMGLAMELESRILPLVATLSDRQAAEAIVASGIIFVCVDRDSARLGVAALAARYNRVTFDFSGGAVRTPGGHVSVGGEAKLAVPGSPPCTASMTEQDWPSGLEELNRSKEQEQGARLANDWQGERPGSSGAVLNSVLGTGELMFWRLLQGKQRESVWLHFDGNGPVPRWEDWTDRARSRDCSVCSGDGLRGLGDWENDNG